MIRLFSAVIKNLDTGFPWQFCFSEIKCGCSVGIMKMFPTKLKEEEYGEEKTFLK